LTTKKGKYHHGDLRKALIDASLGIIAAEGAEALTLRSAAREAGVSHAAPYAHFEDKEDLVAAVKEEGFKELHQLLLAGIAGETTPEARIRKISSLYLTFAAEQPAKYTVMFRRPLGKALVPAFTYIATGRQIFAMLATEIAAMAKERGRALDPHLSTMAAWSMMHGLCSLWNDGPMKFIAPEGVSYEALAERFVSLIVASIGP
jgi:AcrR family transcriptional regulator